jgi:type IV fimbrial biogenesis protein FimT
MRLFGVTLTELLTSIAVTAVLLALALPMAKNWLATYELENHAALLAETLRVAQSEAVKRGSRVNVCKSLDRRTCAPAVASWSAGWLMYADFDRDGVVDVDEPAIRAEGPAPPGITISANAPLDRYVSYTSLGHARMLNGALQMGTFTVCRKGQQAVDVVLANSGRVRVARTNVRCP